MTFSEPAATTIREASIDIAKMIEELTQPPEVPVTDAGDASMRTVDVSAESSLLGDSQEELPSPTPQPGEIEELQFATHVRVVISTAAVVTRHIAPA